MKLLYVITAAEFGGASVHVLQLIKYFAQAGHEVGLVCAPEKNLIDEVKNLKVKLYLNPYFVRKVNLRQDILSLKVVFRAVKNFKPDIIHAHSTKAGYAARIIGKILRIKKVVFTAHGWCFTEGAPGWRGMLSVIERFMAFFTSKIICVSNYDRDLAISYKIAPKEKLKVIYNGIEKFSGKICEGKKRDHFKILFIGRFSPQKDPITLLDAVSRLNSERCELLLVGDGELKTSVEKFIRDKRLNEKVRILGSLKREATIKEIANSDIFVLTTNWEGLPIVILEAMASGKPVIATKVGGIPEIVKNGENGFLVEAGDSKGVALALEKLINSPELIVQMGESGRKIATNAFTIDLMLRRTAELYNSL